MKVEDFNYDLPEELIAQTPLKDSTSSRLLVLNKNDGAIEHLKFHNIIDFVDTNIENICLINIKTPSIFASENKNNNK